MGDIEDKHGIPIYVGDTIDIGGLETEITGFITRNGGADLMAQTEFGEFNVKLIEKVE